MSKFLPSIFISNENLSRCGKTWEQPAYDHEIEEMLRKRTETKYEPNNRTVDRMISEQNYQEERLKTATRREIIELGRDTNYSLEAPRLFRD